MTPKHFSLIFLLSVSPVVASAQDSTSCERAHANCKDGTVYDEKTKSCVVVAS